MKQIVASTLPVLSERVEAIHGACFLAKSLAPSQAVFATTQDTQNGIFPPRPAYHIAQFSKDQSHHSSCYLHFP